MRPPPTPTHTYTPFPYTTLFRSRQRRPIERRIDELARKHWVQQASWKVSLGILHKKSCSKSSDKEFRRAVRELVESDHLPDYFVAFDPEADMVTLDRKRTRLTSSH